MPNIPPHPAEYSPEVLEVIAELLCAGEHVHDPYAGRGLRQGALCDDLELVFSGTDIETWPGADQRVRFGDAADPTTYPLGEFVLSTSPPYLNGISSDYKEGPTERTKGVHFAYGISLGRALHPANLARLVVRSRSDKGASDFWPVVASHVKHWPRRVLLNVDLPMLTDATAVLAADGYEIDQVIPVVTQRIRNGENRELRAEYEVVIEARRPR